jgi:Domain of unknown function (DUF4783)
MPIWHDFSYKRLNFKRRMKTLAQKIVFVCSILLIGVFFVLHAQTGSNSGADNIGPAFKKGDASAIAKHFDGNVIITTKAGSNSYSKSQAEIVLKNFFTAHAPKTFNIAHQGTSPEGSKYFIGALSTSTGNYRVYVSSKVSNTAIIIQEIRFEEQQ